MGECGRLREARSLVEMTMEHDDCEGKFRLWCIMLSLTTQLGTFTPFLEDLHLLSATRFIVVELRRRSTGSLSGGVAICTKRGNVGAVNILVKTETTQCESTMVDRVTNGLMEDANNGIDSVHCAPVLRVPFMRDKRELPRITIDGGHLAIDDRRRSIRAISSEDICRFKPWQPPSAMRLSRRGSRSRIASWWCKTW